MRHNIYTKLSTFLLAITLIFASCQKGDIGPTGPAGPAGAAGAAGPQGPKGDPGAANVIYSDWLDVTFDPNADSSAWVGEIPASKLTDSILNSGDIKVYFNAGSDSTDSQFVMTLPIYEPFLLGAIINPYYTSQLITLVSTADVSSFTDNGNNYFQYRYVLIPGGIKALHPIRINSETNTRINWDDYKQVKKFLGLKD